jgi:CheY-like chemotaxis protein
MQIGNQQKPLILLADDSPTMRKLTELVFREEGFDIVTVSSGEEACALTPRIRPDIVITDVLMPGISGYEVCRFVKGGFPTTPVILLTGVFEPFDPDEADSSGTDCIVTKPFHSGVVAEKVRELLHLPLVPTVATPDLSAAQPSRRRLTVFLCHAKEDKPVVRYLYDVLQSEGFAPWLDEKDLLPGENWDQAIQSTIRSVDAVVVCLSSAAVSKTGYVQKEISFALDVLAEKPEGSVFLVPLLIDECAIPQKLRHLHAATITDKEGLAKVIRALRTRQSTIGFPLAAE